TPLTPLTLSHTPLALSITLPLTPPLTPPSHTPQVVPAAPSATPRCRHLAPTCPGSSTRPKCSPLSKKGCGRGLGQPSSRRRSRSCGLGSALHPTPRVATGLEQGDIKKQNIPLAGAR
ncbi:hypothetical protein T492DRAFT_1043125, partial [Pavlovales sp. CCMP2436]